MDKQRLQVNKFIYQTERSLALNVIPLNLWPHKTCTIFQLHKVMVDLKKYKKSVIQPVINDMIEKVDVKMLYRYEHRNYASVDPYDDYGTSSSFASLELKEYPILSYTPYGFWIEEYPGGRYHFSGKCKRWVAINTRKQFAGITKEIALESFIKRKEKHIRIVEARLRLVKDALEIAKRRQSQGALVKI